MIGGDARIGSLYFHPIDLPNRTVSWLPQLSLPFELYTTTVSIPETWR